MGQQWVYSENNFKEKVHFQKFHTLYEQCKDKLCTKL